MALHALSVLRRVDAVIPLLRLTRLGQLISARLSLATGLFPLALTDSRFTIPTQSGDGYKMVYTIPAATCGIKQIVPGIYENGE